MDSSEKKHVENVTLLILFVTALVLQFLGHGIRSYVGLGVQVLSLVLFLHILFLYNARYK